MSWLNEFTSVFTHSEGLLIPGSLVSSPIRKRLRFSGTGNDSAFRSDGWIGQGVCYLIPDIECRM